MSSRQQRPPQDTDADTTSAVSKRQARAAETRKSLVDAGLELADEHGLIGVSVNLVVERAGVSKGSFFHHFVDRAGYVLALHREFHDRLADRLGDALTGHEPGADRLDVAARTYLDFCLDHRGVRALLLEARADPHIAQQILTRNATSASQAAADFTALAWPRPLDSARLWVGLVAEAALLEYAKGGRDVGLRQALAHMTRR